ncbi:MAG: TolC family protein [Akkermansia sp.]
MIRRLTGILVPALMLGACTLYSPAPLDLSRDTEHWRQFSAALCPPGSHPNGEQLRAIGLLLNPDLNKARLTYARSTEVSRLAGLWSDPSLSFDWSKVMNEAVRNYGITPGLTLPVTGLPRLTRKVAEQYREADYWKMREQERAYTEELEALRCSLLVAHRKQDAIHSRLPELRREKADMARLQQMGEVSFADYQVACQRLLDTEKESQELAAKHLELHAKLVALLGLHPDARRVEPQDDLPTLPGAIPVPTPDALAEAPALLAELATYGATEAELRLEIRRQWPELGISGIFEREEGENKRGFGISLDIPLWNRNREAIAKARGDRALQGTEVVARWRGLMQRAAELGDRQQLALKHCRTVSAATRELEEAEQRQERLFSMGEATLPSLAEARHEVYQRRLNYLDCLEELYEVQVPLRFLR